MSIRILTIEDDQRIRTAVRFALEDEGWSVAPQLGEHRVLARTGQACVEYLDHYIRTAQAFGEFSPGLVHVSRKPVDRHVFVRVAFDERG